MTTTPNPILPTTALLRPQMPGVYLRQMVYDVTWEDPLYDTYLGAKIVPAVGSVVRDPDETPLWVIAVDPVTFVPSYTAIPLSNSNENVVSLLNYGNTLLRLYVDRRHAPYPVTVDSKCLFIGKSPRFYTLTRYPNTDHESVVSQYFDATGQLASQMVPLVSLNSNNNSWQLPRSHTSVILEDNEEIQVKIFSEDGVEVYSALLHVKESAVINEDVLYAPTIVGMTVSGNQQLSNGTFFLYEKQSFSSLGLTVTLVYDDGTTAIVPIDGVKCILYGKEDFIASFSGLMQTVTVKYFRSQSEGISQGLADATGSMISTTVPITVIPNTLATTNKIIPIPMYNSSLAKYVMRYWIYFADGRSHKDVSGYVTIQAGSLNTSTSHFGVSQTYVIAVDMHQVDPVNYTTSAIYQQNVVIQFGPPNTLIKWTIRDSNSSQNIYGQDNVQSRRPNIRYDSTRQQYFIPTPTFVNLNAFIKAFYTQASPPYDPSIALIPQQPTHFVIRDLLSGNMVIAAPIAIADYGQAFTILNDVTGQYLNSVLMVEFLNKPNSSVTNTLFAVPVDVTSGIYIG